MILDSLPTVFKEMMKKYSGDELQLKVAEYVADNMMQDFNPHRFDEPEPQILIDYLAKSPLERIKFDKDYPKWKEKFEVDKYLWKKQECESQNKSNIHWLNEWMKLVDEPRKEVYRLQISKYEETPIYIKREISPEERKIRKIFESEEE